MSVDPALAERVAPRFRYLVPHSLVARRMVLLALALWVAFRVCAAAAFRASAGFHAPGEAPTPAVQAMAWIVVTAVVTGAVMIVARRRGETLLLANLGSPPAATAAWIAALLTVLDWGAWWFLR
jgi:hypothetical protein